MLQPGNGGGIGRRFRRSIERKVEIRLMGARGDKSA
jgi:hypothetical protein